MNGCQIITTKRGNSSNSLDFKEVYSLYRFTKKESKERQSMVYHSVNGFFALRKNEWVFVDCKGSGGWTLPEETAKKLPDTQLYNLKNDTTQLQNVLISHPEIAWEMKRELEAIKTKG